LAEWELSGKRFDPKVRMLANGGRFAEMLTFHCDTTAAVTNKFHGRQFAAAHVGLVNFRGSAERAFLAIAAGVAQMARIFGHRAASFTGMGHIQPPYA
jgi:hypothetical protein